MSKYDPDQEAILRYQRDIERLRKEADAAEKRGDYSARNFAMAQLTQKKGNLESMISKRRYAKLGID